ncbi:MAG: hypothetical protein R2762_24770 [Bryobacteraceae bacterium]
MPPAPDVTAIHAALLAAVQLHPEPAVIVTPTDPPPPLESIGPALPGLML